MCDSLRWDITEGRMIKIYENIPLRSWNINTVTYDKSRNKNTASSCGVRAERSTISHESTSTIDRRLLHEPCSLKSETVWRKVENGTATKCQPRSVLSLKRTSGNSLQMSPQLPVAPSWWRNVQCLMGKDSGWTICQRLSTSWSGNTQILFHVGYCPLNIEDAKYHSKNRNFLKLKCQFPHKSLTTSTWDIALLS